MEDYPIANIEEASFDYYYAIGMDRWILTANGHDIATFVSSEKCKAVCDMLNERSGVGS